MPLAVFLTAALLRSLSHPTGTAGAVLDVAASVALLWWAIGEVTRGVNPFRRLLGAGVLVMLAIGLVLR